ncbi:MAG: RNA methyltransferase, partial [Fibrobacteraceae bacterium]
DARPYGEHRSFGDRKPYGDRDARPYGEHRSFGDRKPYGDRDARPYGERRPFNSEDNRPIFRQKPIATETPDEDPPRDEEAILALADSPDIPVSSETGPVSEDIANPPWFKRLLALTTEKGREREGRFIAEGMRVVNEMLSNHQDIMLGLYVVNEADNAALVSKAHDANINIHTLTEDQMKRLSTTVTTQGVLAVCRMASVKPDYDKTPSILTLVDSVQDPGNLGAIFRTSLGFHSSGIVLGKGTVNPFNPKVVRGSSGTFLRVPFEKDMSLIDAINFLRSKGYTIIATDLHGKQSLAEIEPRKLRKVAFLVGNEGAGTDQHLIEMADETVKIPMSSDLESLNVAVAHGILSFEMAKIQKDVV